MNVSVWSQPVSGEKESAKDSAPEWTPDSDRQTKFGKENAEENSLKGKPLPKSTNFLVYGASVGSPGSINLNVGAYYKNLVFRASGGYWGKSWFGGQVDFGYSFWKTPVIAHSVSLVAGYFEVNPRNPEVGRGGQTRYEYDGPPGYRNQNPTYEDLIIRSYIAEVSPLAATYLEYEYRQDRKVNLHQSYVGLTYDLLLGNFFLQLGGGIGQGDYRNPQLLIQVGYLFDTRSSE
ncbi:hypothetical protein [Leptospira gomenensis]|nr:hypothetical protein [Leptospira gomenensis]